MNQTPSDTPHGHPRTEAALQRLKRAMQEIEAEIAAHGGVYPYNHGRVTQSELCRRADVKKATLQNPVHKETTRVEVIAWCDRINERLLQQRSVTRERTAPPAAEDAAQAPLLREQALQLQLAQAQQRIAELEQENASLRRQLR